MIGQCPQFYTLATPKCTGVGFTKWTSSREALRRFQAMPDAFDLVITDQTMPDLTGAELTQALRHIRPDIPVILCTGFSHVMDAVKAQALGIDAFLQKPLDLKALAGAIEQVRSMRNP